MGAFQSAFKDLHLAIDYFKKWNDAEAEKILLSVDSINVFLGGFSKDIIIDISDNLYNVAKLIPELTNVESSLAQAIFIEIGVIVNDYASIINTEAKGFADINSNYRYDVKLAISNALKIVIFQALARILLIQQNLLDSFKIIADKVNVQSLIESLQKINPDLKEALTIGISRTLSGLFNSHGLPIQRTQSVFTGVVTVAGTYSVILLFVTELVQIGIYQPFTFKTSTINPGPNANEDVISFTVESRYSVHENLAPFQKFISDYVTYSINSIRFARQLKIVSAEVEDESPEVEAYLQHQTSFNAVLGAK